MNNKKLIINVGKTVSENFSYDEIIRIIRKYEKGQFYINNTNETGLFLQVGDKIIVLHSGIVKSRNAFIAQYWPPIIKYLGESNLIQYIDEKIPENKISAPYHQFIFRCLATVGVVFDGLSDEVKPWASLDELVSSRETQGKNGNNSSYITINDNSIVLVGKIYGAQAGESLIILAALNALKKDNMDLFFTPMPENKPRDSKKLPENISEFVKKIGAHFISSNGDNKSQTGVNEEQSSETEIRNQAIFKMNLDKKYPHECYVCGVKGHGLLVASHIDRVADIKARAHISVEEKIEKAVSMENGIWLCRNHDVLFEYGNMWFDAEGAVRFSVEISEKENSQLVNKLKRLQIEKTHLTQQMLDNLQAHRQRVKK